ncbi:MAG: hypothetical protein V7655_12780 [Aequorivita antarctica]
MHKITTLEMNPQIVILLVLIFGLLESCKEPVKEFEIGNDLQHVTLKLYADSTFIEQVKEIQDSFEYSGKWKGNLDEDSIFTTYATNKGFQIITSTPTKTYRIENDRAVVINDSSSHTLTNVEKVGTDAGWLLTDFLDFEQIKQVKIQNVNGPHYLNTGQWNLIEKELKKSKSVGGLRCKPSGPCLTFELKSGQTIQGCVCGDLINFESYLQGSFKLEKRMNFHNF